MFIRMKHRSHPTSTCLTATAPGAPTVPRGVHSCNNIGKLFIITMFIFLTHMTYISAKHINIKLSLASSLIMKLTTTASVATFRCSLCVGTDGGASTTFGYVAASCFVP